ncbi:MAG: hypothetical protein WBV82_22055 [Myxococcaceae bacterium]
MSVLNSIAKNFNPAQLVSSIVGGTVGKVAGLAANVVSGIAQGKGFGEIMKTLLKDVASLAIVAAVTYFTGGTAGLFINSLLDQAKGLLGNVAAKVASSALAKPVANWVSSQITGFAETLTQDFVRQELTNLVLSATGLEDEHEQLEQSHLEALARGDVFATFLQSKFDKSVSAPTREATAASLLAAFGVPVDKFEAP